MINLELQRRKRSEFYSAYGATTSSTIRSLRATANSGETEEVHTRNLFIGDSWFSSAKTGDTVKEFGCQWIGPVKTAKKLFPKEEREQKLANWPGGTHVVMEGISPNGNNSFALGYKYNSRKVLCFLTAKNAGAKTPGTSGK